MEPLDKRSSFAVIGGGVSGLTFAHRMREHGFANVTVFERAPTVGGKSCTVQIDGRAHDLGATMGVPIDYAAVDALSRAAAIETRPFPEERHYNLARGEAVALNRWSEIPAVLAQAAKYLGLHATRWRGADGTGIHRAPAELYRPWAEVAARHGLETVSRRTLAYRTGYGYGFDDEVAGVLYANLLRPQTLLGLTVGRAFMWDGGTQPIWKALAETLDVRVGTSVERIERDGRGVILRASTAAGGRTETRFDRVVIACDPRDALRALDPTPQEADWFSHVESYPYATFACKVEGLCAGERSVGYIDENMTRERMGHPMAWVKRYADHDVFVFHLFAPSALSDGDVVERIAHDVARLGGRLSDVCEARRWRFFPHFSCDFMKRGGLAQIEAWQGRTGAYLIGEVLSFATMARVAEEAGRRAVSIALEAELAAELGGQPAVGQLGMGAPA